MTVVAMPMVDNDGACASTVVGVDAAPILAPPDQDLDSYDSVLLAAAVRRRGGEHGRDGDRRILLSRAESGGDARLVCRASWRGLGTLRLVGNAGGGQRLRAVCGRHGLFRGGSPMDAQFARGRSRRPVRDAARGGDRGYHQTGMGYAGR